MVLSDVLGCHSGLCLLAVPKLSKSQVLPSGRFVETKKAVEDDGRTCALFEVPALSCQPHSFAHVGGV